MEFAITLDMSHNQQDFETFSKLLFFVYTNVGLKRNVEKYLLKNNHLSSLSVRVCVQLSKKLN